MSGPGPCTAAHAPRLCYRYLRECCVLLAAQTRPELPLLYPFLEKRHKGYISYNKKNVSRKPPAPRRDSYVRKIPYDPVTKADSARKTQADLNNAIGALRAYLQDENALQKSVPKGLQRFKAERPESPLFKVLEDRKSRRKREGRKIYDKSRLPALHFSPWANILAERVRMCPATGVRLPVSLLTGFGLVRHPEKRDDVYLLPTELADLDKLERLGERTEAQRAKDQDKLRATRLSKDTLATPTDESSHDQDQVPASFLFQTKDPDSELTSPHSDGEKPLEAGEKKLERPTKSSNPLPLQTETPASPMPVRMLPHLNLFRQMTLKMTKVEATQLVPSVKQPQRLLPQSLKIRLDEYAHYRKLRQRTERETGVVIRSSASKEAELDLANLKWQGDVTARMLTLMRERVVLATQRILELESTKISRRRLQLWSDDFLRDAHARSEAEKTREPDSQPPHADTTGTETPNDTSNPSNPICSQRELQRNRSEALRTVQTKLYLHFGPYPTPLLNDLTTTATGRPCRPRNEHYLPPMLPSSAANDDHAFPFIPLLPLLGAEQHARLHAAVVARVKQEQLTVFGDIATSLEAAAEPVEEQQSFTLVIKASAWHANSVFREMWQLWRYVGGRAALAMREAGRDVADQESVGDPRLVESLGSGDVGAMGSRVEGEVRAWVEKGDLSTLFEEEKEGR